MFIYAMRLYEIYIKNNPRLMVADGFLTNAPDSTYITLTSSRNITDSAPSLTESDATLMMEAADAITMPLKEIGFPVGLISITWWE